ncbi:alpha/beta fold hydrolase [Bacteroidota bacterium]
MRPIFSLLVVIFLLITSCQNSQEKITSVKSADGVNISLTDNGTGEPALIFVHGWCCDKTYWDKQVKYFSKNYRTVAVDLAGHGSSGIDRENYTIQLYGEDIAAVIKKLDLKKVILIGHSMGGYVIIETANHFPDKIVGLVGADTFQDLQAEYTEEQKEMYFAPFRQNFKDHCPEFVEGMFPPNADSTLVNKIVTDMCSAPERVALSSFENLVDYDAISSVRKIKAPVFAINADLWPTNVEGNKEIVESFQVRVIEGIGHFVMNENPDKFNQLLSEIIESILK